MSLSNIYGHHKQIGMLKKALTQKRVGQAYIFSGPDAVGKRTLALEFAQSLNCEKVDKFYDACGQCPSCLKAQHGNHSDIISVQADGQFIRINTIRDIQEQMKFKPLEGRLRVFIIGEADRMNEQAANALLKTLEEPSAANLLILITSRPYSLPATILSRCRHLRFNPLPMDTVAEFLMAHLVMDKSQALLLAGLSGGSIGQALLQNGEAMIAYRADMRQILTAATKRDPFSLLSLASFLGQDKNEIKRGLDILNTFFRDALVLKETREVQMLINQDSTSFIASLASRLSGEQILQNMARVAKARETMELNVNKSLTLETMAFKLCL
jgi:DNA polymerase III subunit delta'